MIDDESQFDRYARTRTDINRGISEPGTVATYYNNAYGIANNGGRTDSAACHRGNNVTNPVYRENV